MRRLHPGLPSSFKFGCVRVKLFIAMIVNLICVAGRSQTIHRSIQIPYGVAGLYSQNFPNVFSFAANQASLASQKGFTAGLYGEKRFLMDELQFCSVAITAPSFSGQFGILVNYSGFSEYSESKIGLAYGKKLGEMVDIGVQFDYNFFHVSGYENFTAISSGLGILLHPAEKINIGIALCNPFGGTLDKNSGEKISSLFRFGMGYDASEQVYIQFELIKEESIPVYANAGLRYAFASQFFAGIGIQSSSDSPYGYAGWRWKNFRIDIEASYHSQLGFTPAIIFIFYGERK